MSLTKKALALEMSTGNFKVAYPLFAENISWHIAGEKLVKGKVDVIAYCDGIAAYFATVKTTFTVANIITEENKVAIDGKAEFVNDKGQTTKVLSCDVYCFTDDKLASITSYCIVTEKRD